MNAGTIIVAITLLVIGIAVYIGIKRGTVK